MMYCMTIMFILAEPSIRPVMIVSPLSDCITDKLTIDFPDMFMKYTPEAHECTQSFMDQGIAENALIDYRKKGSVYECVSVAGLKEACSNVILVFYYFILFIKSIKPVIRNNI